MTLVGATTKSLSRFPAVDGLRAVAALGIVVGHTWAAAGTPRSRVPVADFLGSTILGVDMFFVISGFLLFLPYALEQPLPLRDYARRRFARLVPAYWVSILVGLLAWRIIYRAFGGAFPLASTDGRIDLLVHLSVLQWLIMPLRQRPVGLGINPVWWTLTVEVCFYAALPLIGAAFWRRPWTWAVSLLTFGIATRFATIGVSANHPEIHGRWWGLALALGEGILGYSGHFAVGMLAAAIAIRAPARRLPISVLGPASVVGVVTAWLIGHAVTLAARGGRPAVVVYVLGRPVFAVTFALALYAIVTTRRLDRVLGDGVMRWIGDRSYGIYLFHPTLLAVLASRTSLFTPSESALALFKGVAVMVPLTVVAGAVSFALVERPFIERARLRALVVSARAADKG